MFSWKGILAVFVVGGILAVPLRFYWSFLTRGQRPSESTLILNKLEVDGAPDFSLKGLDGKTYSLKQFAGRMVLVNFWATWCPPCVKEFPSLKALVEHFNGKLVVLAVSHDRDREDIDSFVKAFGSLPKDFIILWDQAGEKTAKLFGTDVLPETYVISQEGKLLRKIAGEAAYSEPMAIQYFEDLMNKVPPRVHDHDKVQN